MTQDEIDQYAQDQIEEYAQDFHEGMEDATTKREWYDYVVKMMNTVNTPVLAEAYKMWADAFADASWESSLKDVGLEVNG